MNVSYLSSVLAIAAIGFASLQGLGASMEDAVHLRTDADAVSADSPVDDLPAVVASSQAGLGAVGAAVRYTEELPPVIVEAAERELKVLGARVDLEAEHRLNMQRDGTTAGKKGWQTRRLKAAQRDLSTFLEEFRRTAYANAFGLKDRDAALAGLEARLSDQLVGGDENKFSLLFGGMPVHRTPEGEPRVFFDLAENSIEVTGPWRSFDARELARMRHIFDQLSPLYPEGRILFGQRIGERTDRFAAPKEARFLQSKGKDIGIWIGSDWPIKRLKALVEEAQESIAVANERALRLEREEMLERIMPLQDALDVHQGTPDNATTLFRVFQELFPDRRASFADETDNGELTARVVERHDGDDVLSLSGDMTAIHGASAELLWRVSDVAANNLSTLRKEKLAIRFVKGGEQIEVDGDTLVLGSAARDAETAEATAQAWLDYRREHGAE